MPLRINLFHEIHLQRKQDATDPFKIFLLIMIVAGVAMTIYYFAEAAVAHSKQGQLTKAKAEFAALEKPAADAKVREAELIALKAEADYLVKTIEERVFIAPLIQKLVLLVPDEVQLLKLDITKPGQREGFYKVNMEGLAAGKDQHPRIVAEDFRKGLLNKISEWYKRPDAKFSKLENGENKPGSNEPASVNFIIDLEFSLQEEKPPAPPPPPRKRKGS